MRDFRRLRLPQFEQVPAKMAAPDKKYGLFIPKQAKKSEKVKIANVFGDDEEEKEDLTKKGVCSKYGVTTNLKTVVKRQTQIDIDKALAEDPNVFEYDKVFDEMAGNKQEKTEKKVVDRKPRYIGQLLKASEKRKQEDERRQERKIQKERDAEGEEFADKEVFVTSAYKKKMEERQKEEERERLEAEMEAKLDVTKQKDLSGFYRFIYKETTKDVAEVKKEDESPENTDQTEPGLTSRDGGVQEGSSSNVQVKQEPEPSDSDSDKGTSPKENRAGHKRSKVKVNQENKDRQRSYRRRLSESNSDSDSTDRHASHDSRKKHKDSASPSKHRVARSDHRDRSSDKHSSRNRSRSNERSVSRKRSKSRERLAKDRKRSNSQENLNRYKDGAKRSKTSEDSRSRHKDISEDSKRESTKTNMDADEDMSSDEDESSPSGEERLKDQTKEPLVGPARPSKEQLNEGSNRKAEPAKSKYARHTTDAEIKDAKARYLARKLARERNRTVISTED